MAAINDPIKMPTFAESILAVSPENAKPAIKIDMVKPIPAKNETPKMCQVEISEGMVISFIFFAKSTNDVIPMLFPMTKLTTMAVTKLNSKGTELLITTPALANANTGIIK